jgi:hypothetical protein
MSGLNVTAPHVETLIARLLQVQSLLTSASLNATTLAYIMLVTAEAASSPLLSATMKEQVITILCGVTESQSMLDGGALSSSILGLVARVSSNITASLASTLLSSIYTVTRRSIIMNQETAGDALVALENVLKGEGPRHVTPVP